MNILPKLFTLILFLLLLAACNQAPKSPSTPTENPLFTDVNLDQARKLSSLETLITAGTEIDISDGQVITNQEDNTVSDFSPQAVLPGEGAKGNIVYIRHNPATANPWAIILFDQVADTKTVVYSGQRELDSVAVNSNGIKVVFSARETTSPTSDYEIYILDLVATTTTQLTSNNFDDINVSHTSNGTGLLAYEDLKTSTNTRSVRWYDGTTTFRLNSNVNDTMPSISGDGKFIAFVRQTITGSFQVRRYEIATATNTSIVSSTTIKKHPSVSENGIKVGWVETLTNGSDRLRVKDTIANTTTNILTNANGIEHAHLRSDGNYVTYGLLNSGFIRVYMRDLTTNTAIQGGSGALNTKGMYWGYQQLLPSNVRVVRAGAPAGGDGTSWASAYRYLQDALYEAEQNSFIADIWVAAGTYYPDDAALAPGIINNDRNMSFALQNNLRILGGFNGTETDSLQRIISNNLTILSGDVDNNDSQNPITDLNTVTGNQTNSYHVLTGDNSDSTAILSGFTITAGHGAALTIANEGGGMRNVAGSPNLNQLIFTGNYSLHGGALYNKSGSNPSITIVDFIGNSANFGGGVYNQSSSPTITNSRFDNNTATQTSGGAMTNDINSNTVISNTNFRGNSATTSGGAIANINSDISLTSVIFENNTAGTNGGAISNAFGSEPSLNNVTFRENSAVNGGSMYTTKTETSSSQPVLNTVSFFQNTASGNGGAMYNLGSSPSLTNVSFSDNIAANGGGIYSTPLTSPATNASPNLNDVYFGYNTASGSGGGMYQNGGAAVLNDVLFEYNFAQTSGGGLHNTGGASSSLTDIDFWANMTNGEGGGIYNNLASITLKQGMFDTNSAATNGGGFYNRRSSPTLTNVVFGYNNAPNGGALFNISTPGVSSIPVLTNVTFFNNTSSSAGGAIRNTSAASASVVNSIFFANTGGTISNTAGSSTTINYSLLNLASLPTGTTGSNNFLNAANPFTNSAAFDLTLSTTPCTTGSNPCAIDSGDKLAPGLVGVTTDLAGNPRFRDIAVAGDKGTGTVPHVDMGAYEKQ
jgi:predicted outer membrane repeat protein